MVRPRSDRPDRLKRARSALPVGALPHPGPATAAWLAAIGVRARQDLERLGVIPACLTMKVSGHPITVVGAYALRAALLGCPWQALAEDERAALRRAFATSVRTAQPRSTRVAARRRAGR